MRLPSATVYARAKAVLKRQGCSSCIKPIRRSVKGSRPADHGTDSRKRKLRFSFNFGSESMPCWAHCSLRPKLQTESANLRSLSTHKAVRQGWQTRSRRALRTGAGAGQGLALRQKWQRFPLFRRAQGLRRTDSNRMLYSADASGRGRRSAIAEGVVWKALSGGASQGMSFAGASSPAKGQPGCFDKVPNERAGIAVQNLVKQRRALRLSGPPPYPRRQDH